MDLYINQEFTKSFGEIAGNICNCLYYNSEISIKKLANLTSKPENLLR